MIAERTLYVVLQVLRIQVKAASRILVLNLSVSVFNRGRPLIAPFTQREHATRSSDTIKYYVYTGTHYGWAEERLPSHNITAGNVLLFELVASVRATYIIIWASRLIFFNYQTVVPEKCGGFV